MPASEIVFMFSGQGSQYFHMGSDLFRKNAAFREWMVRLDDIARRSSGRSVIDALYSDEKGKGDPFDRTVLTHPAIFMAEYSLAQSLIQAGIHPDMVLGVSLGSFAAAAVAGYIAVEDALIAAIKQASVVEEHGERGGMIAVLADPALFAEEFLSGHSELAAVNFSSHFVISARQAELAEIEAALKRRNVGCQRLPVSVPFHSRWIDRAKGPFEVFMRSVPCASGRMPLVCCDEAEILNELPNGFFWNVVRRPIRFREVAARLEQQGTRRYIDVGPAGTLATFLKYGKSLAAGSTAHAILTPFGGDHRHLDALAALLRN